MSWSDGADCRIAWRKASRLVWSMVCTERQARARQSQIGEEAHEFDQFVRVEEGPVMRFSMAGGTNAGC